MTPKQIAAFALGPIGSAALGFITLPLITWFFNQEDIGRLAMLNVVVSFSTLFFSLGLDQAYVREFHESTNRPGLLKITLCPGLFLLLIVLAIFLSFNNIVSKWLFDVNSLLLSILVSIVLISSFLSRFLSLILRMNEQGLAYSMSKLLPKLLLIIIIFGYVIFNANKDIYNLVLASMASTVAVCIVYAWNTRAIWFISFSKKINIDYLKKLLGFGTPLIFGGLAFWGLTAIDKIFLKEFSTYDQLGLYSVAVSFAAAASIFQNVFTTVWVPIVYKWAAAGEGLNKIHKVNRYVLFVVILIFCFTGIFSWVITLMLPSDYYSVQWLVIPCLGYPLLYTLSETTVVGIAIMKRTSFAMLAAFFALAVNVVGNYLLIPKLGATGAAISTCFAFWVFFIMRTEFAIYIWKPMPRLTMYIYTLILLLGAVLNSVYGHSYNIEFIIFWIVVLISSCIIFKDNLIESVRWLISKSEDIQLRNVS